MSDTAPEYLSPRRIAERYDCTVDSVRHWILSGVLVAGRPVRLQALRVGRCWRVSGAAWEAFLAACNPDRSAARTIPGPGRAAQEARAAHERLRKRLRLEDD